MVRLLRCLVHSMDWSYSSDRRKLFIAFLYCLKKLLMHCCLADCCFLAAAWNQSDSFYLLRATISTLLFLRHCAPHLSQLRPSCRTLYSEKGPLLDSTRTELTLRPCFWTALARYQACTPSPWVFRTFNRWCPLCTADFKLHLSGSNCACSCPDCICLRSSMIQCHEALSTHSLVWGEAVLANLCSSLSSWYDQKSEFGIGASLPQHSAYWPRHRVPKCLDPFLASDWEQSWLDALVMAFFSILWIWALQWVPKHRQWCQLKEHKERKKYQKCLWSTPATLTFSWGVSPNADQVFS